jgi:hypothetical protein
MATVNEDFIGQFAEIHNNAVRKAKAKFDWDAALEILNAMEDHLNNVHELEYADDEDARFHAVNRCADIVSQFGKEFGRPGYDALIKSLRVA